MKMLSKAIASTAKSLIGCGSKHAASYIYRGSEDYCA